MKTGRILLILAAILVFGGVGLLQWNSGGTEFLWKLSGGGTRLFPLVGISALIDSINPCAFSVLLITLAFLFSLGKARKDILRIGTSYILGIFAVYVMIGLGILEVLHIFNTPHFMARVGAAAMIGFGILSVVNDLFPSFPIKLGIPAATHGWMARLMEKASLPTAFALGALVGLCEFPCTGGPYLMVLGLLHDQGTYLKGLGYLVFYNLVFVLPLVIVLFLAADRMVLERLQAWKRDNSRSMRLWGGLAMIALGIAILAL